MVSLPTIKEAVLRFCKKERGIIAAYLHGSHALGATDGESDIDIALVAGGSMSEASRRQLRLRAATEIALALPDTKDIDLVMLQDVPVLLRLNVLRSGIRLHERSRAERINYELSVEQAYDDELPYLERETAATLRRMLPRSS